MHRIHRLFITTPVFLGLLFITAEGEAIRRGESWTHLGIDGFKRGDYVKALTHTLRAGWYCRYIDAPFYEGCIELANDGISIWEYAIDANDYRARTYLYRALTVVADYNIEKAMKLGKISASKVREIKEYSTACLLADFKDVENLASLTPSAPLVTRSGIRTDRGSKKSKNRYPSRTRTRPPARGISAGRDYHDMAPVNAVVGGVLRYSARKFCLDRAEDCAKTGQTDMAKELRKQVAKFKTAGDNMLSKYAKARNLTQGRMADVRNCMEELRSDDPSRRTEAAKKACRLKSYHGVLAALEHEDPDVVATVRKILKVDKKDRFKLDVDGNGHTDLYAEFSAGKPVMIRTIAAGSTRYYDNGKKSRVEHRGGGGGRRDLTYYFKDGQIFRIQADKLANHRKQTSYDIDVADGVVTRIKYDEDADGKIDEIFDCGTQSQSEVSAE
ncbi:hypothetical protein ACFL1X_01575 [Candidatus Hydrogenedentota bacterium]